jgi:hypothetical protein
MSNQLFLTHSALANSPTLVATRNQIVPPEYGATPAQTPNSTGSAAATPNTPQKTTEKMVRIAANIPEDVWQKYEQACAYANKSSSARDLTVMFEKMLDAFLEKESKRRGIKISEKKCASACEQPPQQHERRTSTNQATSPPPATENGVAASENTPQSKHSRYIPREVAADVWQRDAGLCTYISPHTRRRCECRRGLQVDHIVPFARGGSSRDASNLRLFCPTHNRMAADDIFGREFVKHCVHRAKQQQAP